MSRESQLDFCEECGVALDLHETVCLSAAAIATEKRGCPMEISDEWVEIAASEAPDRVTSLAAVVAADVLPLFEAREERLRAEVDGARGDEALRLLKKARAEHAAALATVADAEREHRQDWATWIENHGMYVGTVPLSQDEIVAALRGEYVPFGHIAADPPQGDRSEG